jgi:phosphohistidine phosphatase
MVKHLILLRHAKSSWNDNRIDDHERPLDERGKKDAPAMARWLREQQLTPDHVYCSTAKRTQATIDLMSEEWNPVPIVEFVSELYLARAGVYLSMASRFSNQVKCGMLVGHNPGIEIFVGQIAEEIDHMPTCAMAVLHVNIPSWGDLTKVGTRAFRLERFQSPKSSD